MLTKGTYELALNRQKVNTIRRKGLNQFGGKYTGSKGWFKLDIECLKTLFLKVMFKKNIEDQDMEVYKKFFATFDKELIKKNMKNKNET